MRVLISEKTKIYYILLILFCLDACSPKTHNPQLVGSENSKKDSHTKVLTFKLSALDLTEDVSRLSTKNDELIILVYERDTVNQQYPNLLYQTYFVMDHQSTEKEFQITNILTENTSFTFVLIEVDSGNTLQQVEPIVRLNLDRLSDAYHFGQGKIIKDLLGDEELIGLQEVIKAGLEKGSKKYRFEGVHLFDTYIYSLEIKSLPYY